MHLIRDRILIETGNRARAQTHREVGAMIIEIETAEMIVETT